MGWQADGYLMRRSTRPAPMICKRYLTQYFALRFEYHAAWGAGFEVLFAGGSEALQRKYLTGNTPTRRW